MPLAAYMTSHTERQHLVWVAWLDLQLNAPDRHDNYLMQLTWAVARGQVKRPGQPTDYRLKFEEPQAEQEPDERPDGMPGPLTREQIVAVQTALAKHRHRGLIGPQKRQTV